MSEITSTNIRVGPGVYLALKTLSETSGMSIGSLANLLILAGLMGRADRKGLSGFPPEIQTALAADAMSAFGDLLKLIGMAAIKNTSISELYQKLLSPQKDTDSA